MKAILLAIVACSLVQARDVRVRLFWRTPPDSPLVEKLRKTYRIDAKLVATLPLEDYVAGVLAGESSVFTSDEALKAMAVAARTFAIRHMARHRSEGFDLCDTTHCQDLRANTTIRHQLRAAVESTEGEILWFAGAPAATYYHRHCGGTTAAGREVWPALRAPYLQSLPDTFCLTRGSGSWSAELPMSELRHIDVVRRTASGRVAEVVLGSRRISAERFQSFVGERFGWNVLRSNRYGIASVGDTAKISGSGFGHGVGLCQSGAAERGKAGHTYEKILAFYYPGTKLGIAPAGDRWFHAPGERADAYAVDQAAASELAALADRAIDEIERLGLPVHLRPRLRTYPTIARYRDATGSAGWIAATTLGSTVRMQPIGLLRSRGALYPTVLHEVMHVAVDGNAHRDVPGWFREGLVLYLSKDSPQRTVQGDAPAAAPMRRAYAEFLMRVRDLVETYGRPMTLGWLRSGLPREVLERQGGEPDTRIRAAPSRP